MRAPLCTVSIAALTLLAAQAFAAPLSGTEAKRAPAASKAQPAPATGVQEFSLKNGMKVLIVEDHAAPVATFSVFYKVGSRNEYTGNTGSAHLLEHLQFKGTRRFKKGEIMSALDGLGAQWNATTFYDYTNYYATVPTDKLDFVLGLEADRMNNSLILDKERDLERIVVRNELERGENSPTRSLTHDIWSTAFKAHPYHHPVIGWRSDVEGVPTSQLRAFYKTWYQPDNAIAVLVGDFKTTDALALVKKHFDKIPGGHTFPRLYTTEPPQQGERRVTIRKAGDKKVVALAWKAPAAADADTVPLKVLNLILAGSLDLGPFGDPLDPGISNRLYQGLVESELATGAGVDYVPMRDPSLFTVMALPRPDVDHAKVEQAIRAQVERLKTEPVSPEELERAKNRAAAAHAMMQDGTSGRAMLLGYFAAIADWRFADQFPERVRAVTAEDVQRVAREVFDDARLTTGWFVPENPQPAPAEAAEGQRSSLSGPGRPNPRLEAFRGFDGRSLSSAAAPASARTSSAKAASARTAAARPEPASVEVRRETLPNGLVVLIKENHSSPNFTIAGVVKAGGVLDPPGRPNTASITAAALMRGTQKRSKLDLASRLEEVGASLDFGAGSEDVSVSAQGLSKDFDRILELLAETLTQPAFPREEVDKLKRQAIAQLQQAEDSPSTRGRRAYYQALYPKGHPYYVYSLEESIASLEALDPAALSSFHRAHYGANSTVLAITGDVDGDKVLEAVRQRLGGMPKVARAELEIPRIPARTSPGRQVVFMPEKANVDVIIGDQSGLERTDPEYYPAMLANFVFGGSASGRLFQRVRDREGLTYGIYSSLGASHGAGPWSISMTLNPSNVDRTIPMVRQMTDDLVKHGLSDKELAQAKQTLTGKYKVGLATNGGMAWTLAAFESYGFPPDFVDQHPRKIEQVTRKQIAEVLRKHLHPENAMVVIAGTYPPPAAQAPEAAPARAR